MFQFTLNSVYPVRHQTIMLKPGKPPLIMGLSEITLPMGSGPSIMYQILKEQWDVHPSRIVIHSAAPDGLKNMNGFMCSLLWPPSAPDHWGLITIDGIPLARWERTLDGRMKRRFFTLWSSSRDIQSFFMYWSEENDWVKLDFDTTKNMSLALTMSGQIGEGVGSLKDVSTSSVNFGV